MKSLDRFIEEAANSVAPKKCPPGQYYCFNDKKCKKIPTGYRVGYGGMLRPTNGKKMETEVKMVTVMAMEMGMAMAVTVGMVEMVTAVMVAVTALEWVKRSSIYH